MKNDINKINQTESLNKNIAIEPIGDSIITNSKSNTSTYSEPIKEETKPTQETETKTEEMKDFDFDNYLKQIWEREDSIRKETQEREDNAWQRAVTDALKAGVNPNLVNLSPATSGGGITQASNINDLLSSKLSAENSKEIALLQSETNKLIAEIQNDTNISNNTKTNLTNILRSGLSLVTMLMFKGKILNVH